MTQTTRISTPPSPDPADGRPGSPRRARGRRHTFESAGRHRVTPTLPGKPFYSTLPLSSYSRNGDRRREDRCCGIFRDWVGSFGPRQQRLPGARPGPGQGKDAGRAGQARGTRRQDEQAQQAEEPVVKAIARGAGRSNATLPAALSRCDLVDCGAKDEDLAQLGVLKKLGDLKVSSPDISDAGLAVLEKLTELKSISLEDSPVGDKGLEYLKKLPKLEELHLNRTNIRNDGVKHVASCRS